MKKIAALSICLMLAISGNIYAQCFSSTGNPIGGTSNMGVMGKNMFRMSSFYKNSYSGRYFFEDNLFESDIHETADDAVYNYVAFMLAYGITDKFTLEADAGYFINKTKKFATPLRGNGFSNVVISGKYNVLNDKIKRFEIIAKAGVKIPLRS